MTSNSQQSLPAEKLEWLERAFREEQPPALIRDLLKNEGHSDEEIRAAMKERYPTPEQAMQHCKDYVAMAKPRLVEQADALGAVAVDNPHVQLYTIENFLAPALCEQLVEICREHATPSKTYMGVHSMHRTSSTSKLFPYMGDAVQEANTRIANTIGFSLKYSEALQGQIYGSGQEYKAHHDYLPPEYMAQMQSIFELSGPRTWTFMVYLNKPRKGGHTEFTHIGKLIEPAQGKAIIWNNLRANGSPNIYTEHRGCPVEKGSKIILTKWFRSEGYGPAFLETSGQATQ